LAVGIAKELGSTVDAPLDFDRLEGCVNSWPA
jgi:hypothetical protein